LTYSNVCVIIAYLDKVGDRMIVIQLIAAGLCLLNVFAEYSKHKEVSEKVLLWLILANVIIWR